MRKARCNALGFWARLSWVVKVAAPWCLGAWLLVSFTADAGQEVPTGASRAPLSASAAVMPEKLAPEPRLLAASFGAQSGRGLLHEARLMLGAPEQFAAEPDEIEPRADLKRSAHVFPIVDRADKGDPIVGLRPTLGGRWRQKGGLAKMRAEILAYGGDERDFTSSFSPQKDAATGPDSVAAFEAWPNAEKHDYLAAIPAENLEAEKRCLAQAIYFEARSEPEAGQAAVAQVILNRMISGLYPSTICGVVFQNRRHRHACQFSFACDGRALRVRDALAWVEAARVAGDVLAGKTWLADIGSATYYHADYVRPRWARALKKVDVIGKHIFYRLKTGET